MSDLNIPMTIRYLKRRFDIEITDDEIDFYIKNHVPSEIQIQLVKSYFAKYFGSYRDLNLCNRKDYITLMLLLKKKLMIELGYDKDVEDAEDSEDNADDEINNIVGDDDYLADNNEESNAPCTDSDMRPVALPYIISGNLSDHINTRVIRNIKFTEKVESSYTFQKLQEENHKYLNFIKPSYDMGLVSSLINTRFTYVEYEHPELLGQEITYNDNKIADEMLFFLTSI